MPVVGAALITRAAGICRDYLKGAWKGLDPDDFVMDRITGGLSNFLYKCSLPPAVRTQGSEPREVLLRLYGQIHGDHAFDNIVVETAIFTLPVSYTHLTLPTKRIV